VDPAEVYGYTVERSAADLTGDVVVVRPASTPQ
jgi:hypothetical protein